ncbi:MAG: APC family permease [Chloroflexi bacterium]|nr:APC family permease [Chloroflexota bacterium]MBV9892618.1 APC family permease [Chloroflexota bacterium]
MADLEPRPPRRQERSGGLTVSHPDLEFRETIRGTKPGDRFVRIATHKGFTRVRRGYLVPRPGTGEPTTGWGRALQRFKHAILGSPIPTAREAHERLNKIRALAVFSSDALSSVAYGGEEIMKVLVLAGAGALSLTLPISGVIVLLLAIVVLSYRQTIRAYPSGGGSYIVASDNLGMIPGLTAAGALLIDYVLTVSVSVAAGVAALTSMVPDWLPYAVPMSVGAVVLITLANLRGIRESGTIFAAPTYLFVLMMYVLIGAGLYRLATGDYSYVPPPSARPFGAESLGIFLILRAFAQGCSAMTGTEAISNGVPAFKAPESVNARTTLVWMGVLLGTMFFGMNFVAMQIGILPANDETVLSQLGRVTLGDGSPLYIILQIATALILVLAANTSFADFPRLSSILARDRFLPRIFQFRGDRLAFTSGIIALAVFAIALLVIFNGSVDQLIPLYAIGVFASFTLSQSGMVVHWRRLREANWRRSAIINGVGAVTTAIVTVVIAFSKFAEGAWLVILLIPLLIVGFWGIHRHYLVLERARRAETPLLPEQVVVRAVVPVVDVGVQARQALAFARAIAPDDKHVVAVHVTDDVASADTLQREWEEWAPGIELIIVESPYRSLAGPLLAYIDALKETHPNDTITVVLPEFVPSHWWEQLLHNQTALRLKAALLFHPGVVVANVPYHMATKPSA